MSAAKTPVNTRHSLVIDIEFATKQMAGFGLRPAHGADLVAGKSLTEELIGAPLADVAVLEKIQAVTGLTNADVKFITRYVRELQRENGIN